MALWCALLVTASGALVLVGALVLTQRTLDEHAPRPSLSDYSDDPVVLRSEQFAAIEANRVLVEDTTTRVRNLGLAGLAVLAVASLGIGWLVAGRMLAPAARLAETVSTMSAADLGHRMVSSGPNDELKVLSDAFDDLLDRLDRSFVRQRRFVADASHELRTPFAALRSQVDVALEREPDLEQLRTALVDIGEVLDSGTALVNAMLTLSRAETLAQREEVDLAELAAEIVTATPGTDRLDLRLHLEPTTVVGDPVLLEQLVHNLIRNATNYNVAGGMLEVSVGRADGPTLRVSNDGAVLTRDEVGALTSRFRRGPTSSGTAGFGLGLSVAATIATAHDATLDLEPRAGGGLDATVTFPSPAR